MRLAVALGGGGVRGTAHIGVLRELMQMDVRPSGITGTGVGGLVAALYACQCDWREIEEIASSIAEVASGGWPWSLRPSSTRLLELVREKVGERRIQELPIPLRLTAFNVTTGRIVSISEGSLLSALRATTAMAGFFSPALDARGNVLVAGSLFTTYVADGLKGMDRLIVVDAAQSGRGEDDHEPYLARWKANWGRKYAAVRNRMTAMAQADLILKPAMCGISAWAVADVKRCIDAGAQVVREQERMIRAVMEAGA